MTAWEVLESKSFAIMISIASASALTYGGYLTGQSNMTHKMDRMAEQIRDLEADNKARRRFEQCIVANVADAEIPKIKALQCLAE